MSEVEVEDEVEVVVMDEVRFLATATPIIEKEKAQPEDEAEVIQDQGTINPKYSAIIVQILGIIL